jgi:hypothetical protein
MNNRIPLQASEVPETVRQAFADRPHLTMPELSKVSRMDPKTIRRHIEDGRLNWRNIGTGSVRIRRGFVLADVESFYQSIKRGGPQCPSIGTEILRTGNSISCAQVIDFVGRQKSPRPDQNGKRKPLRRKSVGRPSDLLRRSGGPDVSQ